MQESHTAAWPISFSAVGRRCDGYIPAPVPNPKSPPPAPNMLLMFELGMAMVAFDGGGRTGIWAIAGVGAGANPYSLGPKPNEEAEDTTAAGCGGGADAEEVEMEDAVERGLTEAMRKGLLLAAVVDCNALMDAGAGMGAGAGVAGKENPNASSNGEAFAGAAVARMAVGAGAGAGFGTEGVAAKPNGSSNGDADDAAGTGACLCAVCVVDAPAEADKKGLSDSGSACKNGLNVEDGVWAATGADGAENANGSLLPNGPTGGTGAATTVRLGVGPAGEKSKSSPKSSFGADARAFGSGENASHEPYGGGEVAAGTAAMEVCLFTEGGEGAEKEKSSSLAGDDAAELEPEDLLPLDDADFFLPSTSSSPSSSSFFFEESFTHFFSTYFNPDGISCTRRHAHQSHPIAQHLADTHTHTHTHTQDTYV
jgi:hypothetical protein